MSLSVIPWPAAIIPAFTAAGGGDAQKSELVVEPSAGGSATGFSRAAWNPPESGGAVLKRSGRGEYSML